MPRLIAARFESIGHRDARLGGVTLRFTDAKGPCDSVIWLRNGGGKSSILNLLFSLLRPSQREFLGSEAEAKLRELNNYVDGDDVGTICLAWQLDGGIQLLTGVCMELQRAGEGARVQRQFYAVRIDEPERAPISIDTLPLERMEDGRRRLLRTADVREALLALDGVDGVQVTTTKTQREWEDVLDSFGLDPEVFGYQLQMNRREGAADELFRFTSAVDFADFLIEMVLKPEETEQVSKNLGELRASIQRRPRLEQERSALMRAQAELEPLVTLAAKRADIARTLAAATRSLAELRAALDATRLDREHLSRSAALEQELQKNRHKQATQLLRRCLAEKVVFGLRKAELEHARAKQVCDRLDGTWAELDRQSARLRAAELLDELQQAETTRRSFADALAAKLDEHRPLFDRMRTAAGACLRALNSQLATSSGRLELVGLEIARVDTRKKSLNGQNADLKAEQRGTEERRRAYHDRLEAIAATRARLTEQSVIVEHESPADAIERHERALVELGAQDRSAETQQRQLKEQAGRHCDRRDELLVKQKGEQRAHDRVKDALDRAQRTLDELKADGVLQQVLEDSTPDLERLADDAILRLAARSAKVGDELISLGVDERAEARVLRSLEQTELLPASMDVERVQRVLREAGVAAFTGGAYLAENARIEVARARASERPDLAGGVVVTADDLERARSLLDASKPDVEAPVAVGTTRALLDGAQPAVVVLPSDAFYDRRAAIGEREHRREQGFKRGERIEALQMFKRQVDAVHSRVGAFVQQSPSGWMDTERRRVASLAQTIVALGLDAEGEEERRAEIERQLQGLAAESVERAKKYAHIEKAIALVDAFRASGADDVESLTIEEDRCVTRLRTLPSEICAIDRALEDCDGDIQRLSHERDSVRDEAKALERERDQVAPDADTSVAIDVSLAEARAQYAALRRIYEERTANDVLKLQIEDAQRLVKQSSQRFQARLTAARLTRDEVARELEDAEQTIGLASQIERVANNLNQAAADLAEAKVTFTRTDDDHKGANEALAESRRKGSGSLIDEISPQTTGLVLADLETTLAATARVAEEARQTESDAAKRRDEAGELSKQAKTDAERMKALVARIDDVLAPAQQVGAGQSIVDLDGIDERVAAGVKAVRDGQRDLAGANDEAGTRARGLAAFAALPEQAVLPPSIRERLSEPDVHVLLERANDHLQDVVDRVQAVIRELETVERHRRVVAASLLRATDPALRLLRKLQPASVFPASVAMWGGEPFIEVSLQTPPAAESETIAAALVSKLVEPDKNGKQPEVPSGVKLVKQLVRELVGPNGLKVSILKPEVRRRILREPIEKLGSFSRGEQLTAAILLYCTLARLRAQERGQKAPTSVLILDNPLGTCSQPALVELQRSMAAAHQVQLIYTTGIEDLEALARLPRILRLRNAHVDVRGRLHVTVDDTPIRTAQIVVREDS